MFGEITLLVILQGAALVAAGTAAGYFLALQRFDKQRDKLRDELENARTELKEHREQVDSHFLKTGLLFNRLTDNYREIYEHLATGAQSLCSTQITKPQLDQPETRVLPVAVDDATENAQATEQTLHPEAENPEVKSSESERTGTEGSTEASADIDTKRSELETNDRVASDSSASDEPSASEATPATGMDDMVKKPAAAEISAIDEKTADDEHIGADAAPAPTLAQEEKATDAPVAKESPADIDQHKSPPSIH